MPGRLNVFTFGQKRFSESFSCPAGYDDGSAPADHCALAQSSQHQRPRNEKGKNPLGSL